MAYVVNKSWKSHQIISLNTCPHLHTGALSYIVKISNEALCKIAGIVHVYIFTHLC